MSPIVCGLGTGRGSNLIRAGVLNSSILNGIRQRDMSEILSASDNSQVVSGAITLHLRTSESRTRAKFCFVDKLAVSLLWKTTLIGRSIKRVHPAGRKIALHHCTPVPIVMVYEIRTEAEKIEKWDVGQSNREHLALLVTTTKSEPKAITVIRQVALTEMCGASVPVSKHAAELLEVYPRNIISEHYVGMTNNWVMDFNSWRPFYNTASNVISVEIHLAIHQKTVKGASAPVKLVYTKHEYYSSTSDTGANDKYRSVNMYTITSMSTV